MGFCVFSKEYTASGYTSVENKFIAKYMPQADELAVKVYLYGLYLCQNPAREFTLADCAEVLKIPSEKIRSAFAFWEDMDLVKIVCNDPFALEYLPVSSAEGRPKKIRYEKYADFNKELQRRMQTVGIFLDYSALQKYMNFLQANEMEQQAFLLIVEYCLQTNGKGVSHAQIFHKAKNFVARGLLTYNQVEKALSHFNMHTADLKATLSALDPNNRYGEPTNADYALFQQWIDSGMQPAAVVQAAQYKQKCSMKALNVLIEELVDKEKFTKADVKAYMEKRNTLSDLTFKVARRLGVKMSSALPYVEEYTEKWLERGYDENSLLPLASFCAKTERNDFAQLDGLLEKLYAEGTVDAESVQDYLKKKQKDVNLLVKMQGVCGSFRRTESSLNALAVWRSWNFSDEMILEAGKRAAFSNSPMPYINKLLSEWKRENVFVPSAIPEKAPSGGVATNPSVAAADEKAERERWYAMRRYEAESAADRATRKVYADPEYAKVAADLSTAVREEARAEVFRLPTLAELSERKKELEGKRRQILSRLGMTEADLQPSYACKKCSDTGYDKNGKLCDCYSR